MTLKFESSGLQPVVAAGRSPTLRGPAVGNVYWVPGHMIYGWMPTPWEPHMCVVVAVIGPPELGCAYVVPGTSSPHDPSSPTTVRIEPYELDVPSQSRATYFDADDLFDLALNELRAPRYERVPFVGGPRISQLESALEASTDPLASVALHGGAVDSTLSVQGRR